MRRLSGLLVISVTTCLLVACTSFTKDKERPEPRAVVSISDADIASASGENQITRPAGIACTPGSRVEVKVEITGNVVPPPSDTLIGEALCSDMRVAGAQVTAMPPIGFDADRDVGQQRNGQAFCQASWAFMPNPNKPVWKVECKFF